MSELNISKNSKSIILFSTLGLDYTEHIGEVVEETEQYYILKNPITMMKSMTEIGNMSVSCAPFMLSANAKFRIEPGTSFTVKVFKSSMSWVANTENISKDILNEYSSQISGLVVANTMPSKKSPLEI